MNLSPKTKAELEKLFADFGVDMGKGVWTSLTYLPKTKTVYLQCVPDGKNIPPGLKRGSVELEFEDEPQYGSDMLPEG
jgi:hypothetical protein